MATTKKVTDWKMKSPPPSQIYLLTSLFQPHHLVPLWKPLAAEEVTQSDIPKMGSIFSSPHVCFHSTRATKKSQIYFWKHLIHHDTVLPLPPHPCPKFTEEAGFKLYKQQ